MRTVCKMMVPGSIVPESTGLDYRIRVPETKFRFLAASKQLEVQRGVEPESRKHLGGAAGGGRRHRDCMQGLLDRQRCAELGGAASNVCRSAGAIVMAHHCLLASAPTFGWKKRRRVGATNREQRKRECSEASPAGVSARRHLPGRISRRARDGERSGNQPASRRSTLAVSLISSGAAVRTIHILKYS
eukprot:SAG31_NODE_153_length_22196_cov_24.963570_2_plen_188_part_00